MHRHLKTLLHHIGYRIEEIILLIIIILNLLDFGEMLSPGADYIKKIISWAVLGFLLYRASLSKIFFGEKNKHFDFTIVLAYFLLLFKDFIGYAKVAMFEFAKNMQNAISFSEAATATKNIVETTVSNISSITTADFTYSVYLKIINAMTLLHPTVTVEVSDGINTKLLLANANSFLLPFINSIYIHHVFLEKLAFYIGGVLLILLAIYTALKFEVKKPSLLHVLHEEGKLNTIGKKAIRTIVVFIVFSAFFIIVFNLVMEWLAMAVDAPLLVIALFFYLFFIIKHHKGFHAESLIFKIGSLGESFYKKFISLFHSKRGLFLGISGMLVLHLLTDVGNFVIPYTVFTHDPLYFEQLGPGHTPVFGFSIDTLYGRDIYTAHTFIDKLKISWIYGFNIIALLFFLIMPAFVWWCLFKKKKVNMHWPYVVLFSIAIVTYFLTPVFRLTRIKTESLLGVDILTQSILHSQYALALGVVILVSLIIGAIILGTGFIEKSRPKVILLLSFIALIFFGQYIYYFFIDTSHYYMNIVVDHLLSKEFLFVFYFLVFFAMNIIFYVLGFILFIYEIVKEHEFKV